MIDPDEPIPRYSEGWRPEKSLQQTAQDMLDMIYCDGASTEEAESAATTLVELIMPEALYCD